jgi:hypothetical protein
MTRPRVLVLISLLAVTALAVTGGVLVAASGQSAHPAAQLLPIRSGLPVSTLTPSLAATGGIGTAIATDDEPTATPAWLTEINRYRAAAGVGPVTDQPSWDAGILAHLTYVAKAPKSTVTGAYASLHTENPASSYSTKAGALEAGRSDLYFGSTSMTPVGFIDGWLAAPFHAIGILRSQLTQVAFASAAGGGSAGLDVIGGLDDLRPPATDPVLFPGNGMTTNLTSYADGESPDPLETCGWSPSGQTYGLPLIALLPNAPSADLSAQVTGPDGSTLSTTNGGLCLVDEVTYRSSDKVYGPTGQEILQDDHAVLLIARQPYRAGSYAASISQPGAAAVHWSFTVAPQ